MRVKVDGREVVCPWPCRLCQQRYDCYGRPRSHLLRDDERWVAYPEALDTEEVGETWEGMRIAGAKTDDQAPANP